MKKTSLTVIFALALLSLAGSAFAQGANGCAGGKRNGIYYTDCWTDTGDDTARLQSALGTAVGKLIFNEPGYSISGTLQISNTFHPNGHQNSGLIIEGTSASTFGFPTSQITMTASNTPIFTIGPTISEVAFRDLGLVGSPGAGMIGILATAPAGAPSSDKVQFSNLRFSKLSRGIKVEATNQTSLWKFDNIKLDHATFENCDIGVEINSSNSGWIMTNSVFQSLDGQHGVKIIKGGYISMNLLVGNGKCDPCSPGKPTAKSGNFIDIGLEHSVISIQNTVAENYQWGLKILGDGTTGKNTPINLINTGFGNAVEIENAAVVSTGSFFGSNWETSKPKIKGNSDVFSIGDRFCYSGVSASDCPNSGFVTVGNNATLQTMRTGNSVTTELDRSALQVLQPSAGKKLLEIGNYFQDGNGVYYPFTYSLSRDSVGWLRFEASQDKTVPNSPWRGYKFDSPVRLPTYTLANLPTGTTENGTMVYCSNCQKNTAPCTAGTGALAIVVNSQWTCK